MNYRVPLQAHWEVLSVGIDPAHGAVKSNSIVEGYIDLSGNKPSSLVLLLDKNFQNEDNNWKTLPNDLLKKMQALRMSLVLRHEIYHLLWVVSHTSDENDIMATSSAINVSIANNSEPKSSSAVYFHASDGKEYKITSSNGLTPDEPSDILVRGLKYIFDTDKL